MYRPTVRYPDVYKVYVDELFRASTLDRNQIIRLALYTAAYSEEFQKAIKPYLRKDVPHPSPPWKLHQDGLWLELNPKQQEEREDVNAHVAREKGITGTATGRESIGRQPAAKKGILETQGRERAIPITKRTSNGGISIRII